MTEQVVATSALDQFKAIQRQGWAHFAPLATFTTPCAARLVRFAQITAGQRVLDVGCGTGVAAVTAARAGAKVTGADLTPELLEVARENGTIAGLDIAWREADVEQLPFADGQFDVVVSQFGHMFAPRPDVAVREMLRVLAPGGTMAFSTWPPDSMVGQMFALGARYLPPPPAGVSPPAQWGEPATVRERLGAAVKAITFDRDVMVIPTLSPQHHRWFNTRTAGPLIKLMELLKDDAERMGQFNREYEALVATYFGGNIVRQNYLMTRAVKS